MYIGSRYDKRNIIFFTTILAILIVVISTENASAAEPPIEPICHSGMTISVDPQAIQAHLDHGDTQGACPLDSTDINTPGASTVPDPVTPGNPTNIRFEESGQAPHASKQGIYVYGPTAVNNFVDSNILDGSTPTKCPMPVATAGDYWVLMTLGGQIINFYIPNNVPNNNGMVSVPFGGGVDVAITPSNGAKVGTGDPSINPATFGQTTPLAARWHKLQNTVVQGNEFPVQGGTGNSDNTNIVGLYSGISCGVERTLFSGTYQASADFNVVSPVGGEIIPVNTIALVIAGLTTSGIWMVPTLASVAGIGITLYKLQKNN